MDLWLFYVDSSKGEALFSFNPQHDSIIYHCVITGTIKKDLQKLLAGDIQLRRS